MSPIFGMHWVSRGDHQRPTATASCLSSYQRKHSKNAIRQWANTLINVEPDQQRGVALDGKTLQPHGQSIHLLRLLDHATGGVLGQLKMPPTTNEHRAAMTLLKAVDLRGMVLTGDAMFCQSKLCQQIIDSGGDYLFTVKGNQPELKRTIASDFSPGLSPLQRTLAPSAAW